MSEAYTREEQYLSAIAEGTVPDLTPITRKEMFLVAAAGQDITLPEPITREEMFLSKIQGGGGGVSIRNQNKTIVENGTYKADSGYTGLGTVKVAVPMPEIPTYPAWEGGSY